MTKIRLKLIKPVTQTLKLVKLIKDCTDLGLKDSKIIYDSLHVYKTVEFKLRDDCLKKFIEEVPTCGGEIIVNRDDAYRRNLKVLSIGIGEKSEYIDFIIEFFNEKSFEESKSILNLALQKLTKKDLEEIISKISNYDSNL